MELLDSLAILREVDPASALFRRVRETLDKSLEVPPAIPTATLRREPKFLTIGMATHNDYDGCYFTIQAIRNYHPEILKEVEFLVIDNDPAGPCAKSLKKLERWARNYRYIPYRSHQGTGVRDLVFREAMGEFVLCIDSHVLFPPGSLARLIQYCRANPDTNNLLQGPLIGDDLKPQATHFRPVWSQAMYGVWGMNEAGRDPNAPPFEIEMQGLGVFACRREVWPGINPRLDGFGGEEGYVHEKIRRAGGRTLCLPFLRWMHRFERPMGVSYHQGGLDRIRNYLLIYDELGLDPAPVIAHFCEFIGEQHSLAHVRTVQAELASPLHRFDAVYCINLDRQAARWAVMCEQFRKLGAARGVRRFAAADTPLDHRVGFLLSHRRIIAEAKLQKLEMILVCADNVRFTENAGEILSAALQEAAGTEWRLLCLGGFESVNSSHAIPFTHAVAYHRRAFDDLLSALPTNATDAALWLVEQRGLGDFYSTAFGAQPLACAPMATA